MNDEFYNNSCILCKSIINQRLLLLRFDKSKVCNPEYIRIETEELNIEFEKYRNSTRSIAYFLKRNYEKLCLIIPHSSGWEHRLIRLHELYKQSLQIA